MTLDEDTDVIDIAETITDISICQVISFYIFIINNLINGNKNTILACVLCRTLEGINTYSYHTCTLLQLSAPSIHATMWENSEWNEHGQISHRT
jgi:hypothetical protein